MSRAARSAASRSQATNAAASAGDFAVGLAHRRQRPGTETVLLGGRRLEVVCGPEQWQPAALVRHAGNGQFDRPQHHDGVVLEPDMRIGAHFATASDGESSEKFGRAQAPSNTRDQRFKQGRARRVDEQLRNLAIAKH